VRNLVSLGAKKRYGGWQILNSLRRGRFGFGTDVVETLLGKELEKFGASAFSIFLSMWSVQQPRVVTPGTLSISSGKVPYRRGFLDMERIP
jgi:hypothetical protein